MFNIILFGPSGAGKGTQSNLILEKYNLIHFSTGDLLRAEVDAKTELGKQADAIIKSGKLVPDKVVIAMIDNKVKANAHAEGFIFDGFPRTQVQAKALDEMLENNMVAIDKVIELNVEKEILIQRILERGKETNRFDDQNEKLVNYRVNEYFRKTAPLANYYREQGKFVSISGLGNREEVFSKICEILDKI